MSDFHSLQIRHPIKRALEAAVLGLLGLLCIFSLAASASGADAQSAAAPAVLRIGLDESFHNLNPSRSLSNDELEIINLYGGTLTEFTPDASAVRPGLAKSWRLSANGLTYTFALRPGLRFSTGAPLHASDVVATFNGYRTDKKNVWVGLSASFRKVSAPNDRTVVIRLKSPYPSLLSVLAEPVFIVTPASALHTKDFFLKPVSAGRYSVTRFSPSGSGAATLTRNPYYFGRAPSIATLQFTSVTNPQTRIIQLKSGQIDLAQSLPPNTVDQLTGKVAPVTTSIYGGWYIYMNDKTPVLSNLNVRRAISLAVDRSQLSRIVWLGKAASLYSFFPTTMKPWHRATVSKGPNLTRAANLLKGTPCANGCDVTMLVRNSSAHYQDMATVVQQSLAKVGIRLKLQLIDPSEASQREFDGNFELEIGGLTDYTNIPDGFLIYGLQSDGGIFALFSRYKSAKMDALIHTALSKGGSKRVAAVRKINGLFAQDLPFVPLLDWVWVNGQKKSTMRWVKPEPSSFLYVAPK